MNYTARPGVTHDHDEVRDRLVFPHPRRLSQSFRDAGETNAVIFLKRMIQKHAPLVSLRGDHRGLGIRGEIEMWFWFHAMTSMKRTSLGQLAVLGWSFTIITGLLGGFVVYLSFGQPPEKLELARQAWSLGWWTVGTALSVGGTTAFLQWWVED
ncbi:MAG: hypothetical protein N2C14_13565 [Planctomycetales bacterium]